MPQYVLKFACDAHGPEAVVSFEAEDLPAALVTAYREAAQRSAELWEGSRKLCTIRRTSYSTAPLAPLGAAPSGLGNLASANPRPEASDMPHPLLAEEPARMTGGKPADRPASYLDLARPAPG